MLNEKSLTIKGNDCHPTTKDRCKGIVTHADPKTMG
jgi:hypothetical protein